MVELEEVSEEVESNLSELIFQEARERFESSYRYTHGQLALRKAMNAYARTVKAQTGRSRPRDHITYLYQANEIDLLAEEG